MDGGAWWTAAHGVAKSWTRLSDFTFTFHFHALEREMATHSSVLAWRIPGMGEPGGLPSMGLHRVGHDWSDLAAAAAAVRYIAVLKFMWWLSHDLTEVTIFRRWDGASLNALKLSVTVEIRPVFLNKCSSKRCKSLANFKSSNKIDCWQILPMFPSWFFLEAWTLRSLFLSHCKSASLVRPVWSQLFPLLKWHRQPRGWDGEGGSRGREHMYTYGWFMLIYGRNQCNIVKPLSFQKNIFLIKKNWYLWSVWVNHL